MKFHDQPKTKEARIVVCFLDFHAMREVQIKIL
jgi:hypothetical protein